MTSGSDSSEPVVRPQPSVPAPSLPTGLVLQPFRALRYTAPDERLASLTSPPYDDATAAGAGTGAPLDPTHIVRLILPRGTPETPDRYARAAATLQRWQTSGVLREDADPALYVYEQAPPDGGPGQRGLLGALVLPPPTSMIVQPHEDTAPGPVADRLAVYSTLRADLEPVLLLYEGGGRTATVVAAADRTPPLVDAVLGDGLRHRLWALTDPAEQALVAADLHSRTALIADGHHRYAAYLRRQAQHHADGDGPGPWDRGLVLLVDRTRAGPQVHAVHRVVAGRAAAELGEQAARGAHVEVLDGIDLDRGLVELATAGAGGPAFLLVSPDRGTVRLVCRPDVERLARAVPADRSLTWQRLDVTVLHHYLVHQLWGMPDRPDTVQVEHDVQRALDLAGRTHGTAVLLNPTPLDAVAQVAAAGERMPRKSTLITPKPLSGLVLRAY